MKKLLLAVLLFTPSAYAAEGLFTNVHDYYVIEKITHPYKLKEYRKPITVPHELSMRDIKMDSAEDVAIAHFNAMLMGDYGLWLSLWDEKSLTKIMAEHAQSGQDAAFWKKWWRKGFIEFDDFKLTRRVDFGDYTIIEMTAKSRAGDKKMTLDVPIKKIAPSLYSTTEDLRRHVIFQNWRKMGDVIEKTAN